MSKKLFSKEEIEVLERNENIKKISEKGITYSSDFKKKFVEEYSRGKSALEIFEENGLSVKILGNDRIKTAKDRWMKRYSEKGGKGLKDTRAYNQGRPPKKELTLEEKYERLKIENEYLKMENDLLKKL